MGDVVYAKVFSEVLEILKFISKEDYEKIPMEMIELIEDNCNKEYIIEYNPELSLTEQNISDEAKTIIAIFFRDYWATDKQKEKILLKEKQDNDLQEKNKKIYFDSDIFKNKTSIVEEKNVSLLVVKENNNIFKIIFEKIKNFIKNFNRI